MNELWSVVALWAGLGLLAACVSARLKLSTPLVELVIGITAQGLCLAYGTDGLPGTAHPAIIMLAGTGAVLLTFLAGAELDPGVLRATWKEAALIGASSFAVPFVLCTAVAWYGLGWSRDASLLVGVALSETSVAIVYSWMLQSGNNTTLYGKTVLAACFLTDLGTVLALGLFFSPLDERTLLLIAAATLALFALPRLARRLSARLGEHASEPETRFVILALFGLGALALWAGSQAILPAYLIGIALAGSFGRDAALVRRLRTLTFGLLTPFYFIRAGAFVSIPALLSAPLIVFVLFAAKLLSKGAGVHPITRWHWRHRHLARQTTLLMSTGLTFGSLCALHGLSNGIIDQMQYSWLLAAIIGSAIVPTLVTVLAARRARPAPALESCCDN